MYYLSNEIVSAWHGQKLVGLSRSITDFCYCCYLSYLAVRLDYQKQGIGKKLVELTREMIGDKTSFILLAAPEAINDYSKIEWLKLKTD